ncbi:hypothetical protein FBQ97_03420 [Acidobacteria bacterium ACD]|nr:hypothetical protein [Acidobacteria bacterium ACD]
MLQRLRVVQEVAARIADAAENAVEDYRSGLVEQEPALTDRILGGVSEAMRNYRSRGILWSAKTLTDRGPRSQESLYGADLHVALDVDSPEHRIQKGFLAQAKLVEAGSSFSRTEWKRLSDQCKAMLRLSPDSYVLLYSRQGISVVPANAIVGTRTFCNPHELYSRGFATFLEAFLESFVGDNRLGNASAATLEGLLAASEAERLLLLTAFQGSPAAV